MSGRRIVRWRRKGRAPNQSTHQSREKKLQLLLPGNQEFSVWVNTVLQPATALEVSYKSVIQAVRYIFALTDNDVYFFLFLENRKVRAVVTVVQTQILLGLHCLLNIQPRTTMMLMSACDCLIHQVTEAARLTAMTMTMKGRHKMTMMTYVWNVPLNSRH